MKRLEVRRVEAGWNRLPGSHQKREKKHPGKHSHLLPPGELAEGVSPGRAFPWIQKNEVSPVHRRPDHLRRHLLATAFSLLVLAPSPFTPKRPSRAWPGAEGATEKAPRFHECGGLAADWDTLRASPSGGLPSVSRWVEIPR